MKGEPLWNTLEVTITPVSPDTMKNIINKGVVNAIINCFNPIEKPVLTPEEFLITHDGKRFRQMALDEHNIVMDIFNATYSDKGDSDNLKNHINDYVFEDGCSIFYNRASLTKLSNRFRLPDQYMMDAMRLIMEDVWEKEHWDICQSRRVEDTF